MSQPHAPLKPQPWSPADATDCIRNLAVHSALTLDLSEHAKDQMMDRDLFVSDIMHVLRHGFVYENPDAATKKGCYKYKVESTSPVGPKVVRVIAIPWINPPEIKIVTVMWRDEAMQ